MIEDIKVYMDMEQGKNADYWRDITTVTEDELAQLRKIDPNTKGNWKLWPVHIDRFGYRNVLLLPSTDNGPEKMRNLLET